MKVYFDKTITEKIERIPFLNPILWNYEWKPDNTWFYSKDQKLQWTEKWKILLTFSSVEECDYIVFPIRKYVSQIRCDFVVFNVNPLDFQKLTLNQLFYCRVLCKSGLITLFSTLKRPFQCRFLGSSRIKESRLPEGNRPSKAVWNGRENYLTPKSSSP